MKPTAGADLRDTYGVEVNVFENRTIEQYYQDQEKFNEYLRSQQRFFNYYFYGSSVCETTICGYPAIEYEEDMTYDREVKTKHLDQ